MDFGVRYGHGVLIETGAKKTVASGTVKALTKPNGTAYFDVDLGKVLPKYNESSADHVYELRVASADPSFSTGERFSVKATLTHKYHVGDLPLLANRDIDPGVIACEQSRDLQRDRRAVARESADATGPLLEQLLGLMTNSRPGARCSVPP